MNPAHTPPRNKYPRRDIRHAPLGRSAFYSPEDTARFGSTPAFASFQDVPLSAQPLHSGVTVGPAIRATIGEAERA